MSNIIDTIYNFAKGYATKAGAVGAGLTALGAIITDFAANPCHDIACWWALGVKVFGVLAAFGIVRKGVAIAEKAGA